MSTHIVPLYDRAEALQAHSLDSLVATHFDRAFLFFNLFIDDPRTCLELCDTVFRGLNDDGAATERTFYTHLLQHLRELPERENLPPDMNTQGVLCWLLKDSADLSYAEIGALMAMERPQVQACIAEVRQALLG
jgi:hypothetical protein